MRRPPALTVKDVAERAKVSPSTVSLVLRDSPLVAAKTKASIQKLIESIGYVRNRGAGNLRSRTSQTVGLVISDFTNPFYSEFVAGIDSVLDQSGRIAFIGYSQEDPARQDRLIRRMREQNVDGIILSAAEGSDASVVERLRRWNVPHVQAMRRILPRGGDYVGPAIKMGVEAAVDHLAQLGHKRIAYVGAARRTSPTSERLEGYKTGLARHGLSVGPIVRCPPTRENGIRAVKDLLTGDSPPTAAVCYNDICAFGAVLGFMENGLRPQHDFGVVGFDDIAEAALIRPALTTIAISPQRLGQEAAHLLLRRISAPEGPAEEVILPPRLVIRET